MRQLTLNQVFEYYDVPQIMMATDATGTRYLCTLYANSESDGYHYIGVQISEPRLMAFIGGQLDLREAYLYPEVENALYLVDARNETLMAEEMLHKEDISEEMLPDSGYFYDASDLVDDNGPALDLYQLEVPIRDRNTFSTLVSRMGWRAQPLRNLAGKVAIF